METRQVEYAIAVADELSFTRAAQRVFASQSTVSAGVRALEKQLGVVLFERDRRSVRISPAGEAVLPHLRAMVAAEARTKRAADDEGELRGELRVGVLTSVSYLAVPDIIGRFHRTHPRVDLRLRSAAGGSSELAEDVRRGRLDLSLFGLPAAAAPGLSVHRLAVSPFRALLPPDHALAGRSSLQLAELTDETFVDAPPLFGNRVVLDHAMRERAVARDVAVEVTETAAIPAFVAAGLGVALLPEMLIPPASGVRVVALEEIIEWELNIVTRSAPGEVAAALLTHFLDAYRLA